MHFAGRILTFVVFMLVASIARAGEPKEMELGRKVEKGRIYHTAASAHKEQDMAVIMAEAIALRSVVRECNMPHKEIKTYGQQVFKEDDKYRALVRAGIDVDDCETAKKVVNTPAALQYENPVMAIEMKLRMPGSPAHEESLEEKIKDLRKELAELQVENRRMAEELTKAKESREARKKPQAAAAEPESAPVEDPNYWVYAPGKPACVEGSGSFSSTISQVSSDGFKSRLAYLNKGMRATIWYKPNEPIEAFSNKAACDEFRVRKPEHKQPLR